MSFLRALRGERVRPVPTGAVTQSATVAQMDAGGIHWPEAHSDATQMAALALAAHTMLRFDMVRVPFDQTVEAGLLGAEITLGDGVSNCSVRRHPYKLDDPLPVMPDFGAGRARVVRDAICTVKGQTRVPVIGGIVGPFTLTCQLLGLTETLMAAMRKRDAVRRWIEFSTDAGIAYARRQVEAGADAICLEDMSASLDLTSPLLYRELILPAHRRMAAAIPAPVILHICGSNTRILDMLADTGVAALSLEDKTDLARAVALGKCAVIGGVDPVGVLLHGTPETVREACRASLAAGVHVLAPGCGIPSQAPTENLLEMARVARKSHA